MSSGITRTVPDPASGPVLFVRYAYPPNQRGYCGPDDNASFLEYGRSGQIDAGFRTLAESFTGAWPYLELIASETGIADPLDRRVVEAYWIGNELLDRVAPSAIGDSMEERFRRSVGRQFGNLAASVNAGALPHHSYHVFCVYPWLGLLGADRMREHALDVLDKCRIRWAKVVQVAGAEVLIESQPLRYDGRRLELAPRQVEVATGAVDGPDRVQLLAPGDWVAVHWDWVCDRLTDRQMSSLRRHTLKHLAIANDRLAGPKLDALI